MEKTTQWDVTKYGKIIDRSDIEIGGVGVITTKVYGKDEKHYIELWHNGYCVHFSEVMD